MNAQIGGAQNYDQFSEDSANEIALDLQESDYGGETCMAEFNGTSAVPHTEYMCDSDGYCYRRTHSHDDGAVLFLIFFFVYFFLIWCLLVWP